MAKGLNKVQIIGNLGRDPELRHTQGGTAVTNFGVAVGERKKDGDQWVDHTEWFNVTVFGNQAESVCQYLSKGSQAYVEGRLSTRKYQDKEGNDRTSTDLIAHTVLFLSGGGGGEKRQSKPDPASDDGFNDGDDLPF